MKILVPPSAASQLFRNILYRIGFQGAFQLQVNPTAAMAGALWQKFIRRAAKVRFGDEDVVVDIHGIFVDSQLGSCGELSEWIDGRTWRLEVDDHVDLLKRWRRGEVIDENLLGSAEYRAKKWFMAKFDRLLHDIGAYEFARQYQWATCKSQPNCLKRSDSEGDPYDGLVAVDFRAGLVLLPFLPMSPGDFKLIWEGVWRLSLVQFDRGSLKRLQEFVDAYEEQFTDMRGMLDELKAAERVYRDSVPDVTHNHARLLFSRRLWTTLLDSAVTGWKVRNLVDERSEPRLRANRFMTVVFMLVGAIPFLGKLIRRIWARADWRSHYGAMVKSADYLRRAVSGRIAEKVIVWHRAGRVSDRRARKIAEEKWRFFRHLPFSILPFWWLHRLLTDWEFAKGKVQYLCVRPVRLYFDAHLREQWLRDMLVEGQKKHMVSDADATTILSQINEPFIQKYLKSLAVHVCTLPVTQIVSVIVAMVFVLTHPEMPWKKSWAIGAGIILLFQVIPISPGSLVRGAYVVYVVVKERNFKDYNIAVFLGFFKYVGYLAFPIQMVYRYPAIARFMAAHWATEAVRFIPVFGEGGALFEHWVFCLCYNWPLTIRRRMVTRAQMRSKLKQPRYWHVAMYAALAAVLFGLIDLAYINNYGEMPGLSDIWWIVAVVSLGCGLGVTLGGKGAVLFKRIVSAAACGFLTGGFYTWISAIVSGQIPGNVAWRLFSFTILSGIGAIVTELLLPDKSLR